MLFIQIGDPWRGGAEVRVEQIETPRDAVGRPLQVDACVIVDDSLLAIVVSNSDSTMFFANGNVQSYHFRACDHCSDDAIFGRFGFHLEVAESPKVVRARILVVVVNGATREENRNSEAKEYA